MGFYYSDDPVRDAERKMQDEDEWLKSLPVCSYCGQHIQDDEYYEIDEEKVCEECLRDYCEENFKKINTNL